MKNLIFELRGQLFLIKKTFYWYIIYNNSSWNGWEPLNPQSKHFSVNKYGLANSTIVERVKSAVTNVVNTDHRDDGSAPHHPPNHHQDDPEEQEGDSDPGEWEAEQEHGQEHQ